MRVIGTAGHVDHGKTALIKALTGIDTDRLPEEKLRGLTIDLGFAHFKDADGTPVGIIDVPGHERFIRNMVAGAWSLDCALLVIAADDGWMQQSNDHLRVLSFMKVKHVIGVVTKIDAVSDERVEEVETEAAVRISEMTGYTPDILAVSSLSGEGIDELKKVILKTLSGIGEPKPSSPFLYIDRVFSIQGTGVVVTGSLSGGPINVGDTCSILPSGKRVKIRGLQSYYSQVDRALPVSRLACNLQGVSKEELYRGCCISADSSEFFIGNDFLLHIPDIEDLFSSSSLKNHTEYEAAFGTFHSRCSIHYYRKEGICRLRLVNKAAVRWQEPVVLMQHGGSKIICGGTIVWSWAGEKRGDFSDALKLMSMDVSAVSRELFTLILQGYLPKTQLSDDPQSSHYKTETSGEYLFTSSYAEKMRELIRTAAAKPGGVSTLELANICQVDKSVLEALTAPLIGAGTLTLRGQVLLAGETPALSPFGKNLLRRIEQSGTSGFDPAKEKIAGAQKELRAITRIGLAVPLENGIYYSVETYGRLIAAILKGRKVNDRFTIPEVKERTSLSRKYSIPVLNRMEQDGFVKRQGDFRVVVSLPDSH